MEIDIKRFTVMIAGLAVAILLVTTLMVPVISSLSTESGEDRPEYTNTGSMYYKPVGTGTTTIHLSQDVEVIEGDDFPVTFLTIDSGTPFKIGPEWSTDYYTNGAFIPLLTFTYNGHKGIEGIIFNGDNGEMDTEYFKATGGIGYIRYIEGSDNYDYWYLLSNAVYLGDEGDIIINNGSVSYVFEGSAQASIPTTLNADYDLVMTDSETNATYVLTDEATVYGDTSVILCGSVGTTRWEVDMDTGDSTILDQTITSLGFGTESTIVQNAKTWAGILGTFAPTVTITDTDGVYSMTNPSIDGNPISNGGLLVPIKVGGSSGGSGISDTLLSLLSVIPLITVIGIIIGAVGYLRVKD